MELTIVNSGLEAAHSAGLYGPRINATNIKIGDSIYTPDAGMIGIQGNLLYSGPVNNFSVLSANVVQYEIILDETIGDFTFNEVGLFLDSGELFALGVTSTPVYKEQQVLPATIGNRIILRLQLQLSNITRILDFTLVSTIKYSQWENELRAATYNSVDTFSVPGDFLDQFVRGRRVQAFQIPNSVYSYVASRYYDSPNNKTVVIIEDSILNPSLGSVDLSILFPGLQSAVPKQVSALEILGDYINIAQYRTIASSSSPGKKGDITYDAYYLFICITDNNWRRVSLGGTF